MVIQRWQTVLLLVAVIIMGIFCLTPYAIDRSIATEIGGGAPVYVSDAPVFLVLNLVIAALLFISIFMYKNLKRQMTVTLLSMILICASMVTCGIIFYRSTPNAEIIWTGGVILLILALICALFAYRLMGKDRKTLSSYDRLR